VSRPGRALAPGKGPPVPIVQEAGWAPEPVWTQRIDEKSFAPARDRTPVVQPVVSTILPELTRLLCIFHNQFYSMLCGDFSLISHTCGVVSLCCRCRVLIWSDQTYWWSQHVSQTYPGPDRMGSSQCGLWVHQYCYGSWWQCHRLGTQPYIWWTGMLFTVIVKGLCDNLGGHMWWMEDRRIQKGFL
jgi:hypothetical protein